MWWSNSNENGLIDENDKRIITDKEFYKAMQKLKDRGSNAVPPKKSASAYIIFGKEVTFFSNCGHLDVLLEKSRNLKKKSTGKGNWGGKRDCAVMGQAFQGGAVEIQRCGKKG